MLLFYVHEDNVEYFMYAATKNKRKEPLYQVGNSL